MNESQRQSAADALFEAEQSSAPIDPLITTWPEIDLDDAYAIQLLNINRRVDDGRTIKGHKVGLTARVMQQLLGVDEPDYGHLLDDMFIDDGATVAATRFCAPKVEIEIAFVLGRELCGPGCTLADVMRATEFLLPSFEIVDSRVRDWKIGLLDTVADNASSAAVVLGGQPVQPGAMDLPTLGAVMWKNGEVAETGAGAAILNHPANAIAWLANRLAAFNVVLEAGQIVLPGSCVRATDAVPGDRFRADFAGLGSVSVTFG
ncbi:MAG: 2-keto-4-pentenoate hydratase [Rhodospirillaceae bacterium]|nr:2-keto-4-pentenoate hydratase [Rhodospirillaceae bacterium]|tara:strand:+ start:6239 stop:7021 length:783 start_codon:yes stop_codon:yes gene_type:complete